MLKPKRAQHRTRIARSRRRSALHLLPSGRRTFRLEGGGLLIAEESRAREEARALGRLHAEATAAARHDIDRELRALPILELIAADAERHAGNGAQVDIALADA